MQKLFFRMFVTAAVVLFLSAAPLPKPAPGSTVLTVFIIRHGEKPKKGNNLSCEGQYRALALADVLTKKVGKPDFTYVPKMHTGDTTSSVRMFQTVSPFAIKQNLYINSSFKESDTTGAANDVLTRRGVVLMVWEHGNIPPLALALGVPASKVPVKWKGHDFDSIWTIEYKVAADGSLEVKKFDTKGKENINPPPCSNN
jgi:hypothetical protein